MVVTELPTAPLLLLCKNNKTKTGQSDSSAHLSPLHPPAGIKITKTYSYPITISAHAGFFFWHISWKKYSVWVEFSEEISAAVINRYEIREAAKHWEFSNARRHLDYCVCVCVGDEAHLLLAVKLAGRAMPGSRFFRLVGESTLPVLRELECGGKALGWSSLTVENKQSLHPEILQNTTI